MKWKKLGPWIRRIRLEAISDVQYRPAHLISHQRHASRNRISPRQPVVCLKRGNTLLETSEKIAPEKIHVFAAPYYRRINNKTAGERRKVNFQFLMSFIFLDVKE